MVAAVLLCIRSIVRTNPWGGDADAADSEPAEDGVAPKRGIGRSGQIGSQRSHGPASRVGQIDLGRRLRLSGGGAERAEQGNRRTDYAHWYGSHIFRTAFAELTNALDQFDRRLGGWIEPDPTRRSQQKCER
jgi:hypothetical protein